MRLEALSAAVAAMLLAALSACAPSGDGTPAAVEPRAAVEPGAGVGSGRDGRWPAAGSSGVTAQASRGAALFEGNCVACHQSTARGIPNVYPSLVGSAVVLGDPGAFVRWVVQGQRASSMAAGRYTTAMPHFGWMKAPDAAALLTYLRSNFGNSAPPVDAASVAAVLEE